jgi:hypothetical protein
MMTPPSQAVRSGLAQRLQARRPELERATLARVYGISDPGSVRDPDYVTGLREAVSAALAYAITGVESFAERPPVPPELPAQARFAARIGVSLDTVMRRYFAGHVLFCDFIVEEAETGVRLEGSGLRYALRTEAALVDRLLAVIGDAYSNETESRLRHPGHRKAERVRMLLDGEPVDATDLRYELDSWHLGVLAAGPGAAAAVRDLGSALDRSVLLVRPASTSIWAWLGGRRELCTREVLRLASQAFPAGTSLAIGEPGRGIDGWRHSHRQARAALPIALRGPNIVRYTDVALLASALQDEVLATTLRKAYLLPLEYGRDGGKALRQTLGAYLATGRNVSSAAAALGVSRQTVKNRICIAEEKIGHPLDANATEIQTALRLRGLDTGLGAICQPM